MSDRTKRWRVTVRRWLFPPQSKPYRKWVGVVLGFLLPGSAHFLSGKKQAALAWYFLMWSLGFLVVCLMAVPGRLFWGAGLAAVAIHITLWLLMLGRSYRPVWRIGALGWVAFVVLAVCLGGAERAISRLAVCPFECPGSAMAPTIYGVHARPVCDGQEPGSRLPAWLWCGERYIRWGASTGGTFAGPYFDPRRGSWAGYKLGDEVRRLPRPALVRFKHGDTVSQGDLIWSGSAAAGDHVLVDKVSYCFREPRRGEIVAFRTGGLPEHDPGQFHVLRVAGLPGETVEVVPPHLLVDGTPLTEPSIFARIVLPESTHGRGLQQVVLGDDEYFVLGDNAGDAHDSRYWGPLPRKNIVGRVTRIYWPFSRVHALEGKW